MSIADTEQAARGAGNGLHAHVAAHADRWGCPWILAAAQLLCSTPSEAKEQVASALYDAALAGVSR